VLNIIEFLPDATLVIDKDKKVTAWNRAVEEMTGMKKADMLGKNDYAIPFYGEKRPMLIDLVFEDEEKVKKFYDIVRKKDNTLYAEGFVPMVREGKGAYFWGIASPLLDDEGNVIGAVESVRDITEQKKVQEALRESEKKYRNIFENAVEGIFQSTPEGRFINANPAMAQMFGFSSPEEMIKSITSIDYQYYENPERRAEFKRLIDIHGIVEGFQLQAFRKDGSKIWISENVRAVRDEEGNLLYYEGTVEDITKQKHIEDELRYSEAVYRTIFENTGTPMVIINEDMTIVLCNREWVKLSGYSKEETEGKKSCMEFIHKEDLKRVCDYHYRRRKEPADVPRQYEFRYIDRYGNTYNMINTVAMIQGTMVSVAAQLNITDIKSAEETLRYTTEKLRKALTGTIQAMSLTVETRDPYTAGHQRRVANLARTIAKEMGLSNDTVDNIRMAGSIHDIGKISIPAELLAKPTRLIDIEMSLIKVHSQSGYDILKDVDLPYPIAKIVLQHHERLDGSGYPQGLKGDQILLESKIIAVADVVEATASHRPYRPARGIDAALTEIEKNKGILYDPEVVEACLKLFREKGFSFE